MEFLLSGDFIAAQDGRGTRLRPGDFTICDMTRPLHLVIPGTSPTRVMALMLPRALVPLRPREVAELMDLLAAALASRLDRPSALPPDGRRRVLLHQIYAFVDERLGDPDLSPETIAAARHISVRFLYRLFEAEERTVAGWVRHRRLERCRRDLADPSLRDRPVSAIAARGDSPTPSATTLWSAPAAPDASWPPG